MAPFKANDEAMTLIQIPSIEVRTSEYWILGTSALLMNNMSDKAISELLDPHKKSTEEKRTTLKHQPLLEYRAAAYLMDDDSQVTYLGLPATAFSAAMQTAALDVAGIRKTQVERLIRVRGDRVPIWGMPSLHMTMVRMSDINHTPDIRTRCAVKFWASRLHVSYNPSYFEEKAIGNLLAHSGQNVGVGDWRPEKSGSLGTYRLVNRDDDLLSSLIEVTSRDQEEALIADVPPFYDARSEHSFRLWLLSQQKKSEQGDPAVTQSHKAKSRNRHEEASVA